MKFDIASWCSHLESDDHIADNNSDETKKGEDMCLHLNDGLGVVRRVAGVRTNRTLAGDGRNVDYSTMGGQRRIGRVHGLGRANGVTEVEDLGVTV